MILSYTLRLFSICFAAFFLVHAATTLAVCFAHRPLIRMAESLNPRSAMRLLFLARISPVAIAFAAVVGICAPSYVRFEQNIPAEQIRLSCPAVAALGLLVIATALAHGLYATFRSVRFNRLCQRCGRTIQLPGQASPMLVISQVRPFLAQCGIFRPQFVISQRLLAEISTEELAAALRHERAHWVSGDNLKRLLFAFLPGFPPVWPSLETLEGSWAKFAERAADDHVAAEGESNAVSLASALVRLARMGSCAEHPSVPLAISPLVVCDDLAGRVHRLLAPAVVHASRPPRRVPIVLSVATLFAVGCLVASTWPAVLFPAHQILERLLH
jgi:Peptidase family M48